MKIEPVDFSEVESSLFSVAFCHKELGNIEQERETWRRIIAWFKKRGMTEEMELPRKMLVETESNLKQIKAEYFCCKDGRIMV